jgi:hypothetical protein
LEGGGIYVKMAAGTRVREGVAVKATEAKARAAAVKMVVRKWRRQSRLRGGDGGGTGGYMGGGGEGGRGEGGGGEGGG